MSVRKSPEDFKQVLSQIKYKDWTLAFSLPDPKLDSGTPWIKWMFTAPDLNTGEPETQHCRKWQCSYWMTDSEIIRTAFKAALAAEEHEAQEAFTFNGVMVFNPHMDLVTLADLHMQIGDDYR